MKTLIFLSMVVIVVTGLCLWAISSQLAAISACHEKIIAAGGIERLISNNVNRCIAIFEDGRMQDLGLLR